MVGVALSEGLRSSYRAAGRFATPPPDLRSTPRHAHGTLGGNAFRSRFICLGNGRRVTELLSHRQLLSPTPLASM